jgi:transcriptional regulator with XRE-family HTH domain
LESLRHIREQAGYSQQDLTDETGVSQHTISEIELGRRKPQGRTLRKLAKALDVTVADLLGVDAPLGKARGPFSAERALAIADPDEFRRAVGGASTEELQQEALELAAFTKRQTRDNPSSHEEAYQRMVAHEHIGVIHGELARRGASSPVELVARGFDDAMTPSEETQEAQEEAG